MLTRFAHWLLYHQNTQRYSKFEVAIFTAYDLADATNSSLLENTFPQYFLHEIMENKA